MKDGFQLRQWEDPCERQKQKPLKDFHAEIVQDTDSIALIIIQRTWAELSREAKKSIDTKKKQKTMAGNFLRNPNLEYEKTFFIYLVFKEKV